MSASLFKDRKLDWIQPNEVDFGHRYRQDYGDLQELQADFRERGVIQPITLLEKSALDDKEIRELGETDPKKPYLLMAGGRRVTAALNEQLEKIPAQIYDHVLDELELRIIELHENVQRKGMDFREEVTLKERIHELMIARYGVKESTKPDAPGISLRDTAEMLGVSAATMSQDVRLAKALREHPELQGADTKKEAQKLYDQLVKQEARKILLERQESRKGTSNEGQVRKAIASTYMLGSFFDGVKKVKDKSVSLVEIDPPYAIDLKKIKREGETEHYNEINMDLYEPFMRATFAEAHRVLKNNGWMICWFGPEPWFSHILQWIREAGKPQGMSLEEWQKSEEAFKVRGIPGIWTKRSGQTNQPSKHLANAAEFFFYARKGDPGFNREGRINVFEFAAVPSKKKRHPTERPIEMIMDILETFNRPGGLVMVPFAGSGNTLLASQNVNMPAFGWDLAEDYKRSFDVEVLTGPLKKWRSYE